MKTRVYRLLSDFNQMKWKVSVKGLLIGVIAGLLAVVYRIMIEYGTETAIKMYGYIRSHPVNIVIFILAIIFLGSFIAWLVKLEPMAMGSGIPQTEGVVLYGLKMKWHSVLLVRYVGGILCSFFGLSLGREGPSIQIGAAGGQFVAKRMSKSHLEENYLITGGAAAGLSAAFNAPLSGIVFSLEEVHRSFSPIILLAATTASLTADFVSKTFFGLQPVLKFNVIPQLPLKLYIWLLPLGIIAGLTGALINKSLLLFQTLYAKIPVKFRPCVALLLALPIGLFLPEILGGGQNLIKLSESANNKFLFLGILFLAKIIFTGTSFGSGVPGGIFLPILSVGALAGSMVGMVASHVGMPTDYISDFAVCAMAGVLSGAVKAPVTSILLTAEMAGSLIHMLPVAACSFIALLLSDLLKIQPIYEALLERFVEKNENKIEMEEKGGIREFPVEIGSKICGKRISEISWPQGLLIVGIRRGEKEFIPKGNTMILTGDYLVVLTSQGHDQAVGKCMKDSCYSNTS